MPSPSVVAAGHPAVNEAFTRFDSVTLAMTNHLKSFAVIDSEAYARDSDSIPDQVAYIFQRYVEFMAADSIAIDDVLVFPTRTLSPVTWWADVAASTWVAFRVFSIAQRGFRQWITGEITRATNPLSDVEKAFWVAGAPFEIPPEVREWLVLRSFGNGNQLFTVDLLAEEGKLTALVCTSIGGELGSVEVAPGGTASVAAGSALTGASSPPPAAKATQLLGFVMTDADGVEHTFTKKTDAAVRMRTVQGLLRVWPSEVRKVYLREMELTAERLLQDMEGLSMSLDRTGPLSVNLQGPVVWFAPAISYLGLPILGSAGGLTRVLLAKWQPSDRTRLRLAAFCRKPCTWNGESRANSPRGLEVGEGIRALVGCLAGLWCQEEFAGVADKFLVTVESRTSAGRDHPDAYVVHLVEEVMATFGRLVFEEGPGDVPQRRHENPEGAVLLLRSLFDSAALVPNWEAFPCPRFFQTDGIYERSFKTATKRAGGAPVERPSAPRGRRAQHDRWRPRSEASEDEGKDPKWEGRSHAQRDRKRPRSTAGDDEGEDTQAVPKKRGLCVWNAAFLVKCSKKDCGRGEACKFLHPAKASDIDKDKLLAALSGLSSTPEFAEKLSAWATA